jgi:agmatinase
MPKQIKFLSADFIGDEPEIAIIGFPFDNTSCGRKGADQGPGAIRIASDLIETYSPYLNRDLEDHRFADYLDMEITGKTPLEMIHISARKYFQSTTRPVFLGGEHSISIPIVRAAKMVYPDLRLLILDAHCDLRDEYLDSPFNHACISRRLGEIVGWDAIKLLGIRSGTREEFALAQELNLRVGMVEESLGKLKPFLNEKPLYISLDLDIFDPSIVPGTGTPEPGGISYFQFLNFCQWLKGSNLIGFDIVELCPKLDASGSSAVVAASCIRELALIMADKR